MPERKIYCAGCTVYLGVLRDATLKKGIKFLCAKCETKRVALEMQRKTSGSDMEELFGGLFKK